MRIKRRCWDIQQKILELGKVRNDQESLKDLLFETGKSLELAVIKALKLLGYSAEVYNDGVLELDQIILSPIAKYILESNDEQFKVNCRKSKTSFV